MKTKVIIWGHKLHSHTHSYIHQAYYKTFKYLGYDTYWFDNSDNPLDINFFDNCIFLTEGQVDHNIPLNKTAKYILHNCNKEKYKEYKNINIQVYTNDIAENTTRYRLSDIDKIDTFIYYSNIDNTIYQPWATDLLPHEIVGEYIHTPNKVCSFIGMIWGGKYGNINEINKLQIACQKYSYELYLYNGNKLSFDENKRQIQSSELAPAIVGEWQNTKDYIPCRIFKNISYGKIGISNNIGAYHLFEGDIIYAESDKIIDKYLSYSKNQLSIMYNRSCKLVKDKHTYINRINTILKIL